MAPLIAVVGAGAAGLSAALELRDRNARVIVFEASDRPGGKLSTLREDGFLVERAALGVLDRQGDFAPLCQRLGIEPIAASHAARARFVERNGKVHRLASPLALLSGSLFSARERLEMAAEPLRRRSQQSQVDESVVTFSRRRLGSAGTFIGELLQTGIYAGDAETLEASSCFPELHRLETEYGSLLVGALASQWNEREKKRHRPPVSTEATSQPNPSQANPSSSANRSRPRLSSFADGMETLPLAMARALGDALHLHSELLSVRPRATSSPPGSAQASQASKGSQDSHSSKDSKDSRAGGLVLSIVERGVQSELVCDAVILALPAPRLAALCSPFDPALAAPLAAIRAVPLVQVHLGVRECDLQAHLKPHRGFGLLAPGRPTIGTLFPAALWTDRAPKDCALISVLVGGAHFPETLTLDDDALLDLVKTKLQDTVGLAPGAPILFHRIIRWPQAVPQYERGHARRLAEIEGRSAAWKGLHLAGSWLRGVSVLDCLRDGRRAALAALAQT